MHGPTLSFVNFLNEMRDDSAERWHIFIYKLKLIQNKLRSPVCYLILPILLRFFLKTKDFYKDVDKYFFPVINILLHILKTVNVL